MMLPLSAKLKCHRCLAPVICSLLLLSSVLLSASVGVADDADLEAFRRMHEDLVERMEADLPAAAKYLEAQIAASPESADVNVLRDSLASEFARQGKYAEAIEQLRKLLDFQIQHAEQPSSQSGMWMTVRSMQKFSDRSGRQTELAADVERALAALRAIDPAKGTLRWMPVSQLTVLQAKHLISDDNEEAAKALVEGQLKQLQEANAEDATEESMQALVHMLRALTSSDRSNDTWREQYFDVLDQAVNQAVERFPDSLRLQMEFAETQYLMITEWRQDDPEATKKRIETVVPKLELMSLKNRSVRAIARRLQGYQESMAAAKPVATLVGQEAPEWDIDAWVNAGDTTRESLKGKVVLLDFWAMWCGPCIATFPHLREWREEFGDQGFEIVGVTQYYNFEWDADNQRASRADGEVSSEEEQETITAFLKHHELKHPVIVTPKDSKMSGEYGVRGIPHVVLIDREGVVHFVKTGAGEASAKEIHAKIKELLAKK